MVLFPVILVIVAFGHDLLSVWLGADLARQSARVLQILSIGAFLNSLAYFPFSLLQGAGRPDITARLHLAEFPLYAGCMWLLIAHFGIEGAALAWTLRIAADALLLFFFSRRLMGLGRWFGPRERAALILALFSLLPAMLPMGPEARAGGVLGVLVLFGGIGWLRLLSTEERGAVLRLLRKGELPSG
jgi:O-antigen/teichoic acid export membrane protein